jgi:hypothetical protein
MSKPLPMPTKIKHTILRCIETEAYEFGQHSDLDDVRAWLADLERYWPTLNGVEDGRDIFEGKYPITGVPDAQ